MSSSGLIRAVGKDDVLYNNVSFFPYLSYKLESNSVCLLHFQSYTALLISIKGMEIL